MYDEHYPLARFLDNSKIGITVSLNQDESGEPFEATVYFKKSGKNAEELRDEKAITLTTSGKLRLDIGKNSFIEVFAENSVKLKDAAPDESAALLEEGPDVC